MSEDYYKVGSHNVQCDICGAKRKREQVRKTWDGYLACVAKGCWYPKHQNDYPRKIVTDGYPVQDARPRPEMANRTFISIEGFHRWDNATLIWTDNTWRWDDNPAGGHLFIGNLALPDEPTSTPDI